MKKYNKSAFTLLELLTVMAIMVVMMSIAGASYYGMSQGAAMRGSASNLTTTLSLARQFAVNHRNRTHVKLWKEGTSPLSTNYYQVFIEIGRHVGVNNSTVLKLENPKFGTEDLLGGDIYKLTRNDFDIGVIGSAINVLDPDLGIIVTQIKATNVVTSTPMLWSSIDGSKAAWSVRDKASLISGIEFKNQNVPVTVIFKPDGTVVSKVDIGLVETRGEATKTVSVSLFGKVSSH